MEMYPLKTPSLLIFQPLSLEQVLNHLRFTSDLLFIRKRERHLCRVIFILSNKSKQTLPVYLWYNTVISPGRKGIV